MLFFKVFNVNAPLPPREEQEVKECPYSLGYNQNFTSASTQTIPQCQLPAIHIEQTAQPPDTGKTSAYILWPWDFQKTKNTFYVCFACMS